MYTAAELMSRALVTLQEGDSLEDADRYAGLANIRHLPVVRGQKLVGLVTHRDLLRNCRRKDARTGAPITAGSVMTRDVLSVRPTASLREVIRMLLIHKFGCLPVTLENGTLVGIVTDHDLLRVADEHVEQLDRHEEGEAYD